MTEIHLKYGEYVQLDNMTGKYIVHRLNGDTEDIGSDGRMTLSYEAITEEKTMTKEEAIEKANDISHGTDDEVTAELEAMGVDVEGAKKRFEETIKKCRAKATKIARLEASENSARVRLSYVDANFAVSKIISDLTDRRGLKHAWFDIDDDIQEQIKEKWVKIIMEQETECE